MTRRPEHMEGLLGTHLYGYDIAVSIEDSERETGWGIHHIELALDDRIKLSTVLAKVQRLIGFSGYTMTQDYIQIHKGERIERGEDDND